MFSSIIHRLKGFFLHNSSSKQTVINNTFWLLVGDIGYKFVQAVLIFSLAYIIGKEQFGIYSYITSLTGTILLIVDFNLTQTSIRSASQGFLNKQQTIQHSLLLKLFLSTLSLVILGIVSLFVTQTPSITLLLFTYYGYLILINTAAYLRSTYRHSEVMKKETILKLMSGCILLIIGGMSLFVWKSLNAYIIGLSIVGIIDVAATCFFLPSFVFTNFFKNTTVKSALMLATYGLPIAISGFLVNIYINADQIILGRYGDNAGLGIYSFAYKITLLFTIFSSAFFNAIFPKSATHITPQNSRKLFLTGTIQILKRNSIIISLFIASTYLLQAGGFTLLGEYTPALGVLQVLRLYCFIEPIGHWGYIILISIKKDNLNTLFLAITAGINILGNILFIPYYGYFAAARVTVFSYLLYSIFCFVTLNTQKLKITNE